MSDVKETAERISTERLEEMLAGLEGVTPGPWVYGSKYLGAYVNGDRSHYLRIARDGAENSYDGDLWNRNAAHIAGCDPDTMRLILAELLASRHADAQEGGEVGEWAAPAAQWLEEAAKYFERRPTDGEDAAFWANYSNKQFCKGLATRLRALYPRKETVGAPCDPTDAMIEAGLRVDFDNEDERATIINVWHAMSSAAPSNPVVSNEVLFTTIQDAYLRGLDWGRKYSSTEAEELKASYDYADKTTAALSGNPQSGSDKP